VTAIRPVDDALLDRIDQIPALVSPIGWSRSLSAPMSAHNVAGDLAGTNPLLAGHEVFDYLMQSRPHGRITINVEPGTAHWAADSFVEAPAERIVGAGGFAYLVGTCILVALGNPATSYGQEIAKSVKVVMGDDSPSAALGSGALQGTAILAAVNRTKDAVPVFYGTDDGAYIGEFLSDHSRISCVFRDNYAHIMAAVGGKISDIIFQGETYDRKRILEHINHLLAAASKSAA
jgi:hypothetical protein